MSSCRQASWACQLFPDGLKHMPHVLSPLMTFVDPRTRERVGQGLLVRLFLAMRRSSSEGLNSEEHSWKITIGTWQIRKSTCSSSWKTLISKRTVEAASSRYSCSFGHKLHTCDTDAGFYSFKLAQVPVMSSQKKQRWLCIWIYDIFTLCFLWFFECWLTSLRGKGSGNLLMLNVCVGGCVKFVYCILTT